MFRTLIVGLVCASLTACASDQGDELSVSPEWIVSDAPGAVQASFQAGPWAAGTQSVWVRLTGVDGDLGAYQARAQFDASKIELLAATMTDAAGGEEFGVVNMEGASEGMVRFAGFSMQGFAVRDVAELRFSTPRPLEAGDIVLTLDVIGTAEGAEVSADELSVVSAMQPAGVLELGR